MEKTHIERMGAGEMSEMMKENKKKVRWSDADKNRKATNTADKTDRCRVCDCCPRELSDSCSVTTGLLCTQFIVSLYLISLYRCHFPPPSLPPRHPGTFVFPLQQLNGLLLSFSNLDIRSALSFLCFCRVVLFFEIVVSQQRCGSLQRL